MHLSKIREKRTLLINLLYNLALSNLKKSKEPFTYTLSNLENFKELIIKLKMQIRV